MAVNLSDALMQARRRAQLQGRPLSSAEMGGITSGWADSASARLARARQLGIQEKGLTLDAERIAEQKRSNQAGESIARENREAMQSAANKAAIYGGVRDAASLGITGYGAYKYFNPADPAKGSADWISAQFKLPGSEAPYVHDAFDPMISGLDAIPGESLAAGAPVGTQSLTAAELAFDPMISGVDALPAAGAEYGSLSSIGATALPALGTMAATAAAGAGLRSGIKYLDRQLGGRGRTAGDFSTEELLRDFRDNPYAIRELINRGVDIPPPTLEQEMAYARKVQGGGRDDLPEDIYLPGFGKGGI